MLSILSITYSDGTFFLCVIYGLVMLLRPYPFQLAIHHQRPTPLQLHVRSHPSTIPLFPSSPLPRSSLMLSIFSLLYSSSSIAINSRAFFFPNLRPHSSPKPLPPFLIRSVYVCSASTCLLRTHPYIYRNFIF